MDLFYITNSILRMYFIYFNMFLYWITPLLYSFQIKYYYYIIYIMYKTNRQVILYLFQLQQEYMKICFTQEKSCFQRTSPEHFTTTYAISAYHHWCCEFESQSGRGACTTLSDQVCQSLWFSPGPPVSSTNKTDSHDITEILLKVTLNTIKQTNKHA